MKKQGQNFQSKLNRITGPSQIQQPSSLGWGGWNLSRQIIGKYGFSRRMNRLQPLTFLKLFRKKARDSDNRNDRYIMFADYYKIHIDLNYRTPPDSFKDQPSVIHVVPVNRNNPVTLFNHFDPAVMINRQVVLNRLTRFIHSGVIAPGCTVNSQNISRVKYPVVLLPQPLFPVELKADVQSFSVIRNRTNLVVHNQPSIGKNGLILRNLMESSHPNWQVRSPGRIRSDYPDSGFGSGDPVFTPVPDRFHILIREAERFLGENATNHRMKIRPLNPSAAIILGNGVTEHNNIRQPQQVRVLTTQEENSAGLTKRAVEQTAGEIIAGLSPELNYIHPRPVNGTQSIRQSEVDIGAENVQSQVQLIMRGVQSGDRMLHNILRKYENPAESRQRDSVHPSHKLHTTVTRKELDRLAWAVNQSAGNLENNKAFRFLRTERIPADNSNGLATPLASLTFKKQKTPVHHEEPAGEGKKAAKLDEAAMTSQITEKVTQNLARELPGPQLNIIASKVYQIIEKRLTIEKDRRGIN